MNQLKIVYKAIINFCMQKILDFFRVLCSYVPGDNLIWKEIKEKNKKLENFVENENKLWVF